jgi:hypothetical protein
LLNHPPLSIEPLIDGREPRYLSQEAPLRAGGLGEIHIGRALCAPSPLWIAAQGNPDRFEACWQGSSPPGSDKHFKKGLILRLLYERAGTSRPAWLDSIAAPRARERLLDSPSALPMMLYMIKHVGVDPYWRAVSDLNEHDFKIIEGLRFTFIERYNPNITARLPESLQRPVTQAFHYWGISPYDERDWSELAYVRKLCEMADDGGTRLGQDSSGHTVEPFHWG